MTNDEQIHSRAYHKFFEGYAEQQHIEPDGGIHIERVYIGNYYRAQLSKRSRIFHKMIYILLYLVSVCAYIASSVLPVESNLSWYVSAPIALTLIIMLFLGIHICYYLGAKEEMEIRSYKEAVLRTRALSLASCLALSAAACAALVSALIQRGTMDFLSGLSVVLYVCAALCTFLIYALERNISYEQLPPKNARPENSSPIGRHMEI